MTQIVVYVLVNQIWLKRFVHEGQTPLDRWRAKIRRLRQYLRGWAKNTRGAYKKEKKQLLDKLDGLDKKAELSQLNDHKLNRKHT